MKHCDNISITIDDGEIENRLEHLAKRYKKIYNWNETDILQFALNTYKTFYLPILLGIMEEKARQLEDENFSQP